MAEAEKNGSQIIFTNDGDGDRLGVAERVKGCENKIINKLSFIL